MKRLAVIAGVLSALFLSASAGATSFTIQVTLDGIQEGVITPATGSATLILDDVASTLNVSLTFSGLLTATNNAHIHCCSQPPVASPVIIPFVPAGFPLGVTSGSFNSNFVLTPTQLTQVMSGGAYINIHTAGFPGGEIRGQIAAVPEPGTAALLVLGLAGLSVRKRSSS
jgi:hypothetical protein